MFQDKFDISYRSYLSTIKTLAPLVVLRRLIEMELASYFRLFVMIKVLEIRSALWILALVVHFP